MTWTTFEDAVLGKTGQKQWVLWRIKLECVDRDPGAVSKGCGCESGVWRTVHEGHKEQLEQDTCGRAMGPWQRIEAEFEVVWGSWYGIITMGGVNGGPGVLLMAERCWIMGAT